MTKQEIEKAAIVYDRELKRHPVSSETLRKDLVKFGQIVNDHWREKTRWKSLLDEPPKLPTSIDKERLILIKHAKGGYDTKFLVKQSSIDMFLRDGFVAWKEIE